jgi:hypothetical protein
MLIDMLLSSSDVVGVSTASVAQWVLHRLVTKGEENAITFVQNCKLHECDKAIFVDMRNLYEQTVVTFDSADELVVYLSTRKVLLHCFEFV